MAIPKVPLSLCAGAAILLTGCLGAVGPTQAGPGSSPGPQTAEGDTISMTVEIVNWSARWVPEPAEGSTTPGAVKVTVWVNGSLARGDEPVVDARIEGNASVWITPPWTRYETSNTPEMVIRGGDFAARTGADGNVSAAVGPLIFDASPVPPVLFPHCEATDTRAAGTAEMPNATDPSNTHQIRPRMCTQSYP